MTSKPRHKFLLVAAFAFMVMTAVAQSYNKLPKIAPESTERFTRPEVEQRLSKQSLHPIEGLWQLTPEGAVVLIERTEQEGTYIMKSVEAACREVLPGTILGLVKSGGDAKTFDLEIYTHLTHGVICRPKHFTLTLEPDKGRMEFMQRRSSLQINLWHFVPFLWRNSFSYRPDSREYYPGAIRLCPDGHIPLTPVYL